MVKIPIWVLVTLVFFPIADSCVVIAVGLHLKKIARDAVLEGAAEAKSYFLNIIQPLLSKFGIKLEQEESKVA